MITKKEKEYKRKIRNLFFISVDKDLDKWKIVVNGEDFNSPQYNNVQFKIDKFPSKSYIRLVYNQGSPEIISMYRFLFIPLDFKVYRYVNKVKRYFNNKQKEFYNSNKIESLKLGLENLEPSFVKEVRKQKLNEINEN